MKNTAILILNYVTWEETLKEIELLKDICDEQLYDIVVIDNCSPNESYMKLQEAQETYGYVLLKSESNSGYAAGNNIGLRYAKTKGYQYGWILNNDIIIEDNMLLESMIDILVKDDTVAVVNPDIYSPEGYMFNRDAVRPTLWDMTLGMLSYKKKGRAIQDLGGYGYVYRPQGCCMLLDLDKAEEVGYLDEHTFLYSEENILAERFLQKGYRCACCCTSSVIHNHSTTVKKAIDKKKMIAIQLESNDYYLSEYRKYSVLKRKLCRLFYKLKLNVL